MELVDSHCHLDDRQFADDRRQVVERAQAAGLKYMLAIGTGEGPPDLAVAVRLAEEYDAVFATVGVHPNDASKVGSATFADLERLIAHRKVKAIGEIGLDYHWGIPKEVQAPVFERQLEIAAAANMPVVIHTRDAWDDTVATLRRLWPEGSAGVMHCFTGNAEAARECLDLGFYLAFGGVTTFPKSSEIREAARVTPTEKLLLETDAPYLAPVPYRGKRNEPAYVLHTAQVIAGLRGTTAEELGSQTTANFERLFRIAPSAR